MNETVWIKQCQSQLRSLLASNKPVKPLMSRMHEEYIVLYPKPTMESFFWNIQIKAAIDSKDTTLLTNVMKSTRTMNTITLNLLLEHYRNSGEMQTAESIIDRAIKERKLFLNRTSFVTVISGWADTGNVERMMHWFERLKEYRVVEKMANDLQPNSPLLSRIVSVLTFTNNFDMADKLLEDLQVEVEWPVWRVLLKGMIRRGRIEKAHSRFEWLVKEYFGDRVNPIMYSDMLNLIALDPKTLSWSNHLKQKLAQQ